MLHIAPRLIHGGDTPAHNVARTTHTFDMHVRTCTLRIARDICSCTKQRLYHIERQALGQRVVKVMLAQIRKSNFSELLDDQQS